MTAFKGLGTYGNAAGVVTPLDHKMSHTALVTKTTTANVIRAGLFYNGTSTIVSGHTNMSYNVAAYTCATQRSATAGVVFGGNDATYNVATTAAPGSNSRYDVIYHWHREYSIDGTDSNPVIGVVQGTAAPSPTVPSLSAYPGAIELARVLVPAGVTATNSGTTFTQTAPFTSSDGGVVPFRTTTEMATWTTALTGQRARDLTRRFDHVWNGTVWHRDGFIAPTTSGITGTSAAVDADGVVQLVAVTAVTLSGIDGTVYGSDSWELVLQGTSAAGAITMAAAAAGTADTSANHDWFGNGENQASTDVAATSLAQTTWPISNGLAPVEFVAEIRFRNAKSASRKTRGFGRFEVVTTAETAKTLLHASVDHRATTSFDGVKLIFASAFTGTIEIRR